MKKIFFLFLTLWASHMQQLTAQQLTSTMSVTYTIPNGGGPYQPGDEIVVDFTAYNNTGHDISINPSFELFLDNESQLLVEAEPITTGPQTESSIVFTVPDDCTLEDGAYQLQFFVTYSHNWTQQPAIVSTFDGDFNPICNDQDIPIGNPGISEKCTVFTIDVTLQNFPDCCTYEPIILVTATPFSQPPKYLSCKTRISAEVTLLDDDGEPVPYTLEWNSGFTGHTFIHDCRDNDYYVTVSWIQNGQTCTAVSNSVYAWSYCDCPYDCQFGPCPPGEGGDDGPDGEGGITGDSAEPRTSSTEGSSSQLEAIGAVELFPNPNRGHFHLNLENQNVKHIEIVNLLGQQLLQLEGPFEQALTIDLDAPKAGVHFLRIQTQDGRQSIHQFVIQ